MKRFYILFAIFLVLITWLPENAAAQTPADWMPNAGLRRAVRQSLELADGEALTQAKMLDLVHLRAASKRISDLTGIEHATNLSIARFARNQISELEPLSGLTSLRTLRLQYNDITDLTPLSGLTDLTELLLNNNSISDVSPLAGLVNLVTLRLDENSITDLSPLVTLVNVTESDVDLPEDTTAPGVSITVPSVDQTGAFDVSIVFTESVSGFVQGDLTLGGTATASITAWSSTDDITYTAEITPTTSGTVTLSVAESVATDAASNDNTAATSETVTVDIDSPVDTAAPGVSITAPSIVQNGAFDVSIVFTELVSDFVQGDLTLGGTATASITAWSSTDDITYTATITPTTSGTVTLSVAESVATDAASNDNTAATSETVTVDIDSPSVSILVPSDEQTGGFDAVITFSETVSDFVQSDLGLSGTATASITAWSSTDDITYTATITPTTSGTVTLSVAGGVATDAAGNTNIGDTTSSSVTINVVEDAEPVLASVITSVCDRTPQVRDAIVKTVKKLEGGTGVEDCDDVTEAHLAQIRTLIVRHNAELTSLKSGDFDGLSNLTNLDLQGNSLTSLPADIFEGLSKLEQLALFLNSLSTVPAGVFDGLSNLRTLDMSRNQRLVGFWYQKTLSSLPAGVFGDLTSLTRLDLGVNALSSLPSGTFSKLTSLTRLDLAANNFTRLPSGTFDGLSSLIWLEMNDNQSLRSLSSDVFDGLTSLESLNMARCASLSLPSGVFDEVTSLESLYLNSCILSSLPSGVFANLSSLTKLWLSSNLLRTVPADIFKGLTSLSTLDLSNNSATIPVEVSLRGVGDGEFKAVVRTGAPFDIVLPLIVTDGTIDGGATTTTVLTGKSESDETITVTPDATDAVTLEIGNLPSLPTRTENFSRTHSGYTLTKGSTNSIPVFTDGASTTRSVEENTASGVDFDTPVSATDADNDTLTYTLGGTDAASFGLSRTTGQLQTSVRLDYETTPSYEVTITVSDGSLTDRITVTINVTDVPETDVPVFIEGDSTTRSIAEDMASGVDIGSAIFATDANRDTLTYTLGGTDAASFSIDSTTGQLRTSAALDYETQSSYSVTITASDGTHTSEIEVTILIIKMTPVCDRTEAVRDAIVAAVPNITDCNDVTSVHLTAITSLWLNKKSITALKVGDFDGLTALGDLHLEHNQLSSLPSGIFEGLTALTVLHLSDNSLSSLPSDVFDGLTALWSLDLSHNDLSSLPGGLFDGVIELYDFWVIDNDLSSLPDGLFDGLINLEILSTYENSVDPLPITVSLKTVEAGQFTATVHTGAPFNITLPLSVTNGSISGGADSITVSTGSLESEPLTVTRTAGTTAAVTVDIGDPLPDSPLWPPHRGYALVKSATDLPLEVISAVPGAPSQTAVAKPDETALLSNFPNPFNPETWLPYQLAKASNVSITIYDTRGRVVRRLDLGHKRAGYYVGRSRAAHWDGRNASGEKVATGIYFYQFQADNVSFLRKMVILK